MMASSFIDYSMLSRELHLTSKKCDDKIGDRLLLYAYLGALYHTDKSETLKSEYDLIIDIDMEKKPDDGTVKSLTNF